MAFWLRHYLMDIYAAVRLWREPLISFSGSKHTHSYTLTHAHTHTHTYKHKHTHSSSVKPWTTQRWALQDKWTHTCIYYTQRCSAVYPHQCGADPGARPCDLKGSGKGVMVKINPGNWVNRMCTHPDIWPSLIKIHWAGRKTSGNRPRGSYRHKILVQT